jgi:hypothetical protein
VGRRARSKVSVFAAAALLSLLAVPAAQASFHLIKVREVYPGSAAHPNSDYVELQMYSSGQNLVQLGNLKVYDAAGTVTATITPSSPVSASANQSTVLIANSSADFGLQFPGITPDVTSAGLSLSPAAGAVCWPQTEPPFDDCASWGAFTGQASLASTDASPASPSGITDGMAIRRKISSGCPTLLEDADDTNNSSSDFAEVTPAPRPSSAPIVETSCGGGSIPPPVVTPSPAPVPKKCKKHQKLKHGKCVKKKGRKK